MVEGTPKWPCVDCASYGQRPVDMLAKILNLAATDPTAPLPVVAYFVAKCLQHPDTTVSCPSLNDHCDKVNEALGHAMGGAWGLCIDALDHP
ncbi:MAG: hypothetical protein ACYTGV_05985 [Planctomycetota bacterium]|jgi:hypothetical protein